jgi:hypothetical protein
VLASNDGQTYAARSVALSSDGNTAAVGGGNSAAGGMRIFIRSNGTWSQQGPKLLGSGPAGQFGLASQGSAVALSADGNTALLGGSQDNDQGAIWVFARTAGSWTQQGGKIVPGDITSFANFGKAVALSADGNTALVGGPNDAGNIGAAWIFARDSSGNWSQQGPKLTGNDAVFTNDSVPSGVQQGTCVALSTDGNTALVGGPMDHNLAGAAWVYTRANGVWSQQGSKLVAANATGIAEMGASCALAYANGSEEAWLAGPAYNNFAGGVFSFFRFANWQSGGVYTAPTAVSNVAVSSDGNVRLLAGANGLGGGTTWVQAAGLQSEVDDAGQGPPLALSADGRTALLVGGTALAGQVSVFTHPGVFSAPAPGGVNPTLVTASSQTLGFGFSDPLGYQDLGVVNILINGQLDGRHACYLAYSQPLNVLYLVADDGNSPLPGSVLNSSGSISNSQCTVSWGNAPVSANGLALDLTLTIAMSPGFIGNKLIYLAARDLAGDNSGWQVQGFWQRPLAPSTTTTSVIGVNPAYEFVGLGLVFNGSFILNCCAPSTFSFSDSKGYQDLGVVNILADSGPWIDGRHACYLAYIPRFNHLYLVNDSGTGLLPDLGLDTPGSLSNSQCSVSWAANPVTASGNNLSLTLTIQFLYFPTQVFYLAARDVNENNNTGWLPMGIVTFQILD